MALLLPSSLPLSPFSVTEEAEAEEQLNHSPKTWSSSSLSMIQQPSPVDRPLGKSCALVRSSTHGAGVVRTYNGCGRMGGGGEGRIVGQIFGSILLAYFNALLLFRIFETARSNVLAVLYVVPKRRKLGNPPFFTQITFARWEREKDYRDHRFLHFR